MSPPIAVCEVEQCLQDKGPLSQRAEEALAAFLATERVDLDRTVWYGLCTEGQPAQVFFKAPRNNIISRKTASELVADAYKDLRSDAGEIVLKPKFVFKLRQQASSIRAILPPPRYLPASANTEEFRSGLDSLCDWSLPVSAPTSQCGDPSRRAFTLSLARKFADAFASVPVDYIHHLVMIGWPMSSHSATRRVLTFEVTERIRREAEAFRKQENAARSTATLAIQIAASSRYAMDDDDRQTVEQLKGEIERIKRGRRRFPSDAAKLKALREIASSFDDPDLRDEFMLLIDYKLKDFLG